MIFKSSHPLSPEVEISIPGVGFDYMAIKRLTLELSENKHDALKILVTGINPRRVIEFLNTPVDVKWSHNDLSHRFVGYITHIDPEHQARQGLVRGSPLQISTVYCLGASFDMKQKRNNVWDDVTLDVVVREIAQRYRYSVATPRDDFVFHRIVQGGESDWELLSRLCSQLGYSLTIHGTHIHIFDRYKALSRDTSLTSLTVPGRRSGAIQPGQIMSFNASLGYLTPEGNVNEETLSVLDNQGKINVLTSGKPGGTLGKKLPGLFTDELSHTSLSVSDARRELQNRQRSKYPFTAHVEATGTIGVVPGGLVDVQDFDSQFDGLWYVTDVSHVLTRDKYYTDLSIIKDSLNGTPRRTGTTRANRPPTSVLRPNKWQASTQKVTVYD
jgi:hypothetical protein